MKRAPAPPSSDDVSEEAKPVIEPSAVRRVLGHAHLVDVFDGTFGRKFQCYRCHRWLPEDRFIPLGPRFLASSQRPITALHPHCHTCRKQAKGKWVKHELYKPKLDRYFTAYVAKLRGGASARGLFFGIDAQDVLGKFIEQDGRCALTGIQMEPFKAKSATRSGRHLAAPSVDRIDNKRHYTPDNIQLVLWAVNGMKGDLPQNVFIELCHQISVKNLI